MRLRFFWIFLFSFTGCDSGVPNFVFVNLRQRAEQAEADGRYHQALELYERSIDDTPAGRECHYRMALIYDSTIQNSVGALYHFQRFFEKSPQDPRIEEVLKDIKRLRLLIVSQLSEGVLVSRAESIRLRNENLSLQTQLIGLRSKKKEYPKMYSRKPPMNQDIRRQIIARTPCRTYTVQQGDTLSIIAKRFYHTSQRWKDIADANQTQLHGSTHLRVGMSLVIP